jgi:hypothetical protein
MFVVQFIISVSVCHMAHEQRNGKIYGRKNGKIVLVSSTTP